MSHALFAFDDREAAHRAVRRLTEAGWGPTALELHEQEDSARSRTAREVDEQVTGGLLTNLMQLLQGVFDWGDAPHDASPYADTIRRGGAVVSVDAEDDARCAEAEQAMQAEGCAQRTGWGEVPRR